MREKPAACAGCPAAEYGRGFVPPSPSQGKPKWVILGQGPGQQEAVFGTPFWPNAPSGRMLRRWLAEAGLDPRTVTFGNIVQCWLPSQLLGGQLGKGSRPPTRAEMLHCWRAYVGPWLHSQPADAHVLTVGAPASRFLLGLADSEPAERLAGVTHHLPIPPVECPPGSPLASANPNVLDVGKDAPILEKGNPGEAQ
jgi:uracil-DNA glycosylase family 4